MDLVAVTQHYLTLLADINDKLKQSQERLRQEREKKAWWRQQATHYQNLHWKDAEATKARDSEDQQHANTQSRPNRASTEKPLSQHRLWTEKWTIDEWTTYLDNIFGDPLCESAIAQQYFKTKSKLNHVNVEVWNANADDQKVAIKKKRKTHVKPAATADAKQESTSESQNPPQNPVENEAGPEATDIKASDEKTSLAPPPGLAKPPEVTAELKDFIFHALLGLAEGWQNESDSESEQEEGECAINDAIAWLDHPKTLCVEELKARVEYVRLKCKQKKKTFAYAELEKLSSKIDGFTVKKQLQK